MSRRPRASGYFRTDYGQDLALIQTRLARISHTKKCIGAPNQRKLLCHNAFLKIQERPDDDGL